MMENITDVVEAQRPANGKRRDPERERLAALRRYDVVDATAEEALDRLTRLAADLFDVPIALISFVDEEAEWFPARFGLERQQVCLGEGFGSDTIASADVMVVEDAAKDERFAGRLLVAGAPGVRFYAGAPLVTPDGFRIGTFCVMDTEARGFDAGAAARLQDWTATAMTFLEQHRQVAANARAEAGHRDAREEAEGLLESITDAFFALDEAWRFTYVNGHTEHLLERRREELLGRCVWEEVPGLVSSAFYEKCRRAMQEQVSVQFEEYCLQLGRWFEVNAYPRGGGGVSVFLNDVDDRKAAEADLQRSEERFRTLVERATSIITVLEPDGTVRYESSSIEHVLGYTPEELEGTDIFAHIHPGDREWARGLFASILEQPGETVQGGLRFRHADGSWVHLEALARNLLDDPAIEGVVINSRDVSERKEAEAALRESEARHRALVSHASDIMTILEKDGTIRYESLSAERVVGHKPVVLEGTNVFEWIHPDDQEQAYAAFEELLDQPITTTPVQFRFRHANGSWVHLESVGRNLLDDPNVEGVVINSRDITDSLRFEAEREARERAEELLEAKSSFLNNMSHELRTPLTAILGFADVLAEEGEHLQRQQEFAACIVRSGRRLQKTLDSVLSLAQLDGGGSTVSMKLEPTDVVEEVRQAVASHHPIAAEKQLSLEMKAPAGKVCAPLNAGALHRILDNLFGNAIKFTDEGGITVRVGSAPGEVRISVADTGVGIGEEFQTKLFEDFTQESTGLSRTHEGSGLGLAITRRLVELMDGTIDVESIRGEGTVFTVRFPCATTLEASFGETVHEAEDLPTRAANPGGRLLVVEDNENTRALACHVLSGRYEVAHAAGSEEALALVGDAATSGDGQGKPAPFDALFIDINLGASEDGVELLHRLRALPAYAGVPAVAFTAHAMPGDRERYLEAGFESYLSKPFSVKELLAAAQDALQ